MKTAVEVIAVGFDGSPDSIAALRWASALCLGLDGTLRVVHVVGLLEERHLLEGPPVSPEVAIRVASEAGLPASRVEWIHESGSPADVLVRMTQPPQDIDLLVVGTRGTGRQHLTTLGSTSAQVAQDSSVPVAIVPNPV
jgi:nucleotide-binding universal stress UspA family protein